MSRKGGHVYVRLRDEPVFLPSNCLLKLLYFITICR